MSIVHPKLRIINLHNVTKSLISQNPREWMFIVQVSLLIVTFLSLISQTLSLMQTTQEINPHPRIALRHVSTCGVSPSFILILLLLMPLVECWCTHMTHRPGKPSGVDHNTTFKCYTLSYSMVSHTTLIL